VWPVEFGGIAAWESVKLMGGPVYALENSVISQQELIWGEVRGNFITCFPDHLEEDERGMVRTCS